jgi:hypothetical protein
MYRARSQVFATQRSQSNLITPICVRSEAYKPADPIFGTAQCMQVTGSPDLLAFAMDETLHVSIDPTHIALLDRLCKVVIVVAQGK